MEITKNTLKTIYMSLVRSIIDYSSLIIPSLSKSKLKSIQAIQNISIRAIYKKTFDTSTMELRKISDLPLIYERANELNTNFIINGLINENEIIQDTINEYIDGGKNFKNQTFLCKYRDIIKENMDLIGLSKASLTF